MSSEPINFGQERLKRRPGESAIVEKPARKPRVRQECPPAPQPQREPEDAPPPKSKPEPPKGPRCSCCSHLQERVQFLLDLGRGVLLCDGCVQVCNEILHDEGVATDAEGAGVPNAPSSSSYGRTIYRCSFCGKEQDRVARLVAMLNNLFICNTCVGVCNAGIAQALAGVGAEGVPEKEGEG